MAQLGFSRDIFPKLFRDILFSRCTSATSRQLSQNICVTRAVVMTSLGCLGEISVMEFGLYSSQGWI